MFDTPIHLSNCGKILDFDHATCAFAWLCILFEKESCLFCHTSGFFPCRILFGPIGFLDFALVSVQPRNQIIKRFVLAYFFQGPLYMDSLSTLMLVCGFKFN